MNGFSLKWSRLDFPITVFFDRGVSEKIIADYRTAAIKLNNRVGRALFDLGAIWFAPSKQPRAIGSMWLTQDAPCMGPLYCGFILLCTEPNRIKSATLNVCNSKMSMPYALEHILGLWQASCEITIFAKHVTINIPKRAESYMFSSKSIAEIKKFYM